MAALANIHLDLVFRMVWFQLVYFFQNKFAFHSSFNKTPKTEKIFHKIERIKKVEIKGDANKLCISDNNKIILPI